MNRRAGEAGLLVIDVQRAAVEGCADADGLVERINDLARRAHAAEAPVIFVQHEGNGEPERGEPGWELADGLERPDGAHVVAKRFRDAFAETGLEELLRRSGVQRVVVTGVHSDYCVQMTAISAVVRGFDLTLVADGHAGHPRDPSLGADRLRDLVNARISTLRHPGRSIEVVRAAEVSF